MKKFLAISLAAAALFATAGVATAQSIYIDPGIRVGPRYNDYDRPRYRRYDDGRRYYRRADCRRGYSVQDGVCKPYRGY